MPLLKINSTDSINPRETTLTIDDLGVIRLIYLRYVRNGFVPDEVWVSSFRSPKQYMYSTSNIVVTNDDTLSYRKNGGGWGFSARAGVFRLFMISDTTKTVEYKYSSFSITPGQIFDKDNYEPPSANFPGIKYQERCGFIKFLDLKSPFVF